MACAHCSLTFLHSYRNIARLFTKISSGGADDGYSSIPEPKRRGKKAAAPPPEPSGGGLAKAGKAAKALFLGK